MRSTNEDAMEAVRPAPNDPDRHGVTDAADRLESCTARLLDHLSFLRQRLSAVLVEPDGKGPVPVPVPAARSPLADALHVRADEIEDASRRVLWLTEALDL